MDGEVRVRAQGLDMARGAAVILMVVYHMCVWPVSPSSNLMMAACKALSAFRMPVLFLISGFLTAGIVHKPKRQALSRISNLAWLYLLWLPAEIVLGPVEAPATARYLLENLWQPWTELWFIWVLIVLTASLFVVVKFPRRTVLLVALLVSTANLNRVFDLAFSHDNLFQYAPLFYVGALYRGELKKIIAAPFSLRTAAIVIAILALIRLSGAFLLHLQGWQLFTSIERILVCVIAIYLLKPVEKMPLLGRWMALAGQNTLPIYLAHLPLWALLRIVMPNMGGVITPLISSGILVAISLILYQYARDSRLAWLFRQPSWWSRLIAQVAGRAAWAVDRRYAFR